MRVAIISDIHGNLEAFRQVLADIDRSDINGLVCLGDNIGYGPEPEEVVKLVRERKIPCLMGNHELAIIDPKFLDWMNFKSRKSILLTQKLLSNESIDFIHTLKNSMIFHGSRCVHGCPPDVIITYLFELSKSQLKQIFLPMVEKICFAGHTHQLKLISFSGENVTIASLQEGLTALSKKHQYIINVGSVGQPRDGNNKAKYVIWDISSNTVEVKFIPYDIAKTANKILEYGFPKSHAKRLW